MRRRGITLVELLLALAISVMVMMAAGNAYVIGLRNARDLSRGRDALARRSAFMATLTDLFGHAYVDADTTNANTYFLSGDAIASAVTTTTSGTVSASGNASSGSGDNTSLVFTVMGRQLPRGLLSSTADFETNNGTYGPVAGVTEVQLGMTATGTPSAGQTGLFLREQAPADTDPSQGGFESVLSPDVESISFEFYDGAQWLTTWDTTTMTPRRLPSAVRVTFRLKDDTEDTIVTFAVPTSDVTTDNPVTQSTTTTATTTGGTS